VRYKQSRHHAILEILAARPVFAPTAFAFVLLPTEAFLAVLNAARFDGLVFFKTESI
jgi:hypothetical protein